LTRSGARPGDAILVTGQLGGSLLGHHLTFQPRIEESLQLHERYLLHAAMDISDGLSLDLQRLVTESGVGAELDLTTIPIAQAAHMMSQTSGRSPLQHALSDGEDFELLLVAPADEAARIIGSESLTIPVTQIGTIIAGEGIWFRDAQGDRRPLAAEGYLH
jgi:thiamine-monophosphate kinase